jgi:signal transduction histidine kinase
LINEALSGALGLSWTRILFNSQARLNITEGANAGLVAVHSAALMRGKETLGVIYFARHAEHPFKRDENGFLGQIADAVALAIDRLTKLEQSETLKHQWEATFDAILDPVSLITDDFTVVRINRRFAERSGAEPEKVIGRKCFEALFGRTQPCEGCEVVAKGANFRLKPARTVGLSGVQQNAIFDVFSQEIQFKPEGRALFVNMYHDVSAQLRFERQILESAKMAELGTIGSSIAHELNNPLGGMLSFLQLIKMDLKGDEPWFADIDEMEKGARRCRDIVQSLLGFTRKSSPDIVETIDLREVIEQALKITELQTRSMGISVVHDLPIDAVEMRGQFNQMAQALRNFLQNAQEAIAERIKASKDKGTKYPGEIKITLRREASWNVIEILDNGAGFDPLVAEQIYDPMYTTKATGHNPGLGLTVAQQIIRDHGGSLEISSTKGAGTKAKISLPILQTGGVSSSF